MPRDPSNLTLNTCRDGPSTVSLDNLFHCLITFSVKNLLITSNLYVPSVSLKLLSLILSLWKVWLSADNKLPQAWEGHNEPEPFFSPKGIGTIFSDCLHRRIGNSFILKEGVFSLNFMIKFLTQRIVMHWNKLPRETVDVPS